MQKNRIIYVLKEALHIYPPCISQILMLDDLGYEVIVLYGACDKTLLNQFKDRGIKCIELGNKRLRIKYLSKIFSYLLFRIVSWKHIKTLMHDNTIIWFGTADGAIALTGKYKKKKYVLSILELYDKYPFYKNGLGRIIHDAAAIITCESNRAKIMKSWWGLSSVPYVMPNKPYQHPRNQKLIPSSGITSEAISKIKGKKCIIYQGIISQDRDLCSLAEALKEIKQDYLLVLIGKEYYDGVRRISEIYENTIYLGFFPSPMHLEITSYGHIGIANYDDSSLNNLFCAPNKIYEYTGFGIPILGNDVPGLVNTIGNAEAGICADFTKKIDIIHSLNKIELNYEYFSQNARKFYNETNNVDTIKHVVDKLFDKSLNTEKD